MATENKYLAGFLQLHYSTHNMTLITSKKLRRTTQESRDVKLHDFCNVLCDEKLGIKQH
jgi:hypothetical protein